MSTLEAPDDIIIIKPSHETIIVNETATEPEIELEPPLNESNPQLLNETQNSDEDSIEIETDESQRSKTEPLADENTTVTELNDTGSKAPSIGSTLSNSLRYRIPRTISKTHLKDTIQIGYLVTWFFAILLSTMVVVGDWIIVKIFNLTLCDIENNTDSDNIHIKFLSWNAFAGFIQQLWIIIICLGGFSLFYMPNLVGMQESDSKQIRTSRIKLFGVMIIIQLIVQLFLVPIYYNFRSIFNSLLLFLFLLWAYYEKGCEGTRALYPLWAVIVSAVLLYYVVGGMIFTSMNNSTYAVLYPFWLSFCQWILIKLLEHLDGCKCCKSGIEHLHMNEADKRGSCRRQCMKRLEFWKKTAATNVWPKFWIYYACALVVVMAESFRIASYVVIKESKSDLLSSFIIGMISEVMTRNMVYKLIWDKFIMRKKTVSPLSKPKAIYLGCKYHTDYIPVLILVSFNVLSFGHTNDCYYSKIASNVDITNGYEWMIGVFIVYEMVTDGMTYFLYRMLKRFEILTRDTQDKTIKMAIVMLTKPQMFTMMLSLGYWSFLAYIYDDAARPEET